MFPPPFKGGYTPLASRIQAQKSVPWKTQGTRGLGGHISIGSRLLCVGVAREWGFGVMAQRLMEIGLGTLTQVTLDALSYIRSLLTLVT